jgi:hypothetical protein
MGSLEMEVQKLSKKSQYSKTIAEVFDLRSASKLLAETSCQLLSTKKPVDPHAELAGV